MKYYQVFFFLIAPFILITQSLSKELSNLDNFSIKTKHSNETSELVKMSSLNLALLTAILKRGFHSAKKKIYHVPVDGYIMGKRKTLNDLLSYNI